MDSSSPFKDLLLPRDPKLTVKALYLVGTVLKIKESLNTYFVTFHGLRSTKSVGFD